MARQEGESANQREIQLHNGMARATDGLALYTQEATV